MKINQLKTFFKLSTAAFEFQNSIHLAFFGYVLNSKMQMLHKLALAEIEKENPNLLLIDELLEEVEELTKN